ncbi:MAG: hypothetical protein ABL955_12350, partial [Elusimicrobiota bacterium]
PLQAKPRAPLPDADAVVLKALTGPATGYVAVERVQVFRPGQKPKAIKANIFGLPGKPVRREVLAAKKKAAPLIQVRDREAAAAGLARLRDIYTLSVSTGGVVARHKTWKIELRLRSGALRRALWVDRDSGLLMKRETYRNDGSLARRERIVKLTLPAPVDPVSLKPDPSTGPWMPDGYVFVGESGGAGRYSNGLESYELRRVGGKTVVSGELAEDDAARILESSAK